MNPQSMEKQSAPKSVEARRRLAVGVIAGVCVLALAGFSAWVVWDSFAPKDEDSANREAPLAAPAPAPVKVVVKSPPVIGTINLRGKLATATVPAYVDPAQLVANLPASEAGLRNYIVRWEEALDRDGRSHFDAADGLQSDEGAVDAGAVDGPQV